MFFFFKQKTAYEMRISDWSSDVCSSDLPVCKAAMLAPCNPIQIEEEAWLWLTNEFVDLAADVAQIDVRAIGAAHVNRMAAAEIHADMWRAGAKDLGIRG